MMKITIWTPNIEIKCMKAEKTLIENDETYSDFYWEKNELEIREAGSNY